MENIVISPPPAFNPAETYTLGKNGGVVRDSDGAHIPNDPGNSDSSAYQAWVTAGNKATPAPVPPVPPRTATQNQWCYAMDSLGKLPDWLAAADASTTKAKDRAYVMTGGNDGLYVETSTKLARLCAIVGVQIGKVFDIAAAS